MCINCLIILIYVVFTCHEAMIVSYPVFLPELGNNIETNLMAKKVKLDHTLDLIVIA